VKIGYVKESAESSELCSQPYRPDRQTDRQTDRQKDRQTDRDAVMRVGGDGGLASGARREEESCWTEEKRGGAGALRQKVSQGLSRPLNASACHILSLVLPV